MRLFREPREVEWWRGRAGEAGLDQLGRPDAPLVNAAQFHSEFGGFVQRHSGWLDTAAYLEASRAFFEKQGRVAAGCRCRGGNRTARPGRSLARRRFQPRRLLPRCGTADRLALFFVAQVRLRPRSDRIAQGRFAGEIASSTAAAGCCRAAGGDWRAGSTYEFDLKTPMEASVADLRGKLAQLLRVPFEITEAQAGDPADHQASPARARPASGASARLRVQRSRLQGRVARAVLRADAGGTSSG